MSSRIQLHDLSGAIEDNPWLLTSLFLVATTLLYAATRSMCLDDVDSINYALGLQHYNLSQHQPHPPGAPVFIFLAKLFHWIGFSVKNALIAAASLGGGIFVAAWFYIYRSSFDLATAVVGGIAIALLPGVWMTSTKPMSDSLAAALIAIAVLFAVRFYRKPKDWDLYLLALFGGLAVGVRPQFGPMVLLVIATVLVSAKADLGRWFKTLFVFAAVCLGWLLPTVYSQSSVAHGPHGLLNYYFQLQQFSHQIGNIPEWSLAAGDLTLMRVAKKVFIHAAGCFYLAMGLNVWYPDAFNSFLAKLGTELHPWNPGIAEWSIAGTVYFFLYVGGILLYIRSNSLAYHSDKAFWKLNWLWPLFHFGMMVYAVPPSNRQYLPILPILLVPPLLGWRRATKGQGMVYVMLLLMAANIAPLAYRNHTEPAPPVALMAYLDRRVSATDREHVLLVTDSNTGRHARWYLEGFKTAYEIEPSRLSHYLQKGMVFTTNKPYFEKHYPNLPLFEIKRFQRSIRIWNRHNSVSLYRIPPPVLVNQQHMEIVPWNQSP